MMQAVLVTVTLQLFGLEKILKTVSKRRENEHNLWLFEGQFNKKSPGGLYETGAIKGFRLVAGQNTKNEELALPH